MAAVLDRASERRAAGVRLLQSAFRIVPCACTPTFGFDTRETVSKMHGAPLGVTFPGYDVRPALSADLAPCNALCQRIHGHHRGGELGDAIKAGTAQVVETSWRDHRLRHGYRVLRPCGGREQPGAEGADWCGQGLFRGRISAADRQWRTVPLVP